MVAKINIGSSLFGALSYNQKKIDEENASVLYSNKMRENMDGNFNVYNCMLDFECQMPQDMKTEKPIIHISLNPHPDDVLSDAQLADIAVEYLDKLGYGNQPYIVYKHEDIERTHIHIVSLRVDSEGNKIDDKFEHRRSKDITRELEKKYNLITAEKRQRTDDWKLAKLDIDKGDVKNQISNIIKPLSKMYHFQSFNEYRALLSLYNISAEEIKGTINGKAYSGLIYSAVNDKCEKIGNPFKSSLFGKAVGYDEIHKRIGKSKVVIKDKKLREQTRNILSNTLNNNYDRKTVVAKLSAQNIDVLFRENDAGRIYGVTFIDHNNNSVFNGSHLGKAFSANNFNDMFNSKPNFQENNNFEFENHNTNNSVSDAVFDIFTLDNGGSEEDEQAFKRNLKKSNNKKKQRKL